jgi:hypothetical protein
MKEEIDDIIQEIKKKRKVVSSSDNYSETEWQAIDSYNLGLTEAIEIIERRNAKDDKGCQFDGFYQSVLSEPDEDFMMGL